ncbi:hypothetical protein [Candidatus Blastococcus massiliensis]|nr:hypothetical protein [Candidatus Blastococcus massiliensis]
MTRGPAPAAVVVGGGIGGLAARQLDGVLGWRPPGADQLSQPNG